MNDLTKPISPPNPNALPERWIDALFLKLAAIYGKSWLDQWQGVPIESVKATWSEQLAGVSGEQIKAGLMRIVREHKWPPTLPEFYRACVPLIAVPPANDHRAIDSLAQQLGVSILDCDSYESARSRLLSAVSSKTPHETQVLIGSLQ